MKFPSAVQLGMEETAKTYGFPYTKKNLLEFIRGCTIQEKGIPQFMTKYAGQRFKTKQEGRIVLGKCWGGSNKRTSVWFTHVPKKDVNLMEREVGEWKILWKKYSKEQVPEVKAKPIVPSFLKKKVLTYSDLLKP